MTEAERDDHGLIDGKRRKRIARGSGTSVQEVNQVLKQYLQMRKMMKQYGALAAQGRLRGMGKARARARADAAGQRGAGRMIRTPLQLGWKAVVTTFDQEQGVPHPLMFKGAGFVLGKGVPNERESVAAGRWVSG